MLAAGDGQRVQAYVRHLTGEALAKQYVNFVGTRSMLEHTFERVEKLIPRERILTVVSADHLVSPKVRRQLASRPSDTIIVQPENRETGLGILLPLMFLYKRCPDAIVAIFPSDHFIVEEDRFMNYVRLAAQAVLAGGLWNTMTMVFELRTLFGLVRKVYPGIYFNFCRILDAIDTPTQSRTIAEVYQLLEPVNFSKGLLERIAERYPEALSVLPIRNVFWSDWGSPERIARVLQERFALAERESQ